MISAHRVSVITVTGCSLLVGGCVTTAQQAGPRVDRSLIGHESSSQPRPVQKRSRHDKVSRIKTMAYSGKCSPSYWNELSAQMSRGAITKALITSSVFVQNDIDQVVRMTLGLIGSQNRSIRGKYAEFDAMFMIYFNKPSNKEAMLCVRRIYRPGAGVFKALAVLDGTSNIEDCFFNMDGELLDIVKGRRVLRF